ncbi:MAG: hypothetical protein NZ805_03890 [Armatimonadetes bacterium]|nr:hypothetical protein [Armatimonadota bacterium]MDW8028837.1 hypothetical protein [Armatimonadota bacterium]
MVAELPSPASAEVMEVDLSGYNFAQPFFTLMEFVNEGGLKNC